MKFSISAGLPALLILASTARANAQNIPLVDLGDRQAPPPLAQMPAGTLYFSRQMRVLDESLSDSVLTLYPGYVHPLLNPELPDAQMFVRRDRSDTPPIANEPIQLEIFRGTFQLVINRPPERMALERFASIETLRRLDPDMIQEPIARAPDRLTRDDFDPRAPAPAWCVGAANCLTTRLPVPGVPGQYIHDKLMGSTNQDGVVLYNEIRVGTTLLSDANLRELRRMSRNDEPIVSIVRNTFFKSTFPLVRFVKAISYVQGMRGNPTKSLLTFHFIFALPTASLNKPLIEARGVDFGNGDNAFTQMVRNAASAATTAAAAGANLVQRNIPGLTRRRYLIEGAPRDFGLRGIWAGLIPYAKEKAKRLAEEAIAGQ